MFVSSLKLVFECSLDGCSWPASDRAGRLLPVRMVSDFGLLCNLQGIVNLNLQLSDSTLELCMPQQQLYRSEILRPLVDQGPFCAPQRVGGVLSRVQADPRFPRLRDPRILPRRDMRGASQAAWEEELTGAELGLGDPSLHRLSCLVGQFKLHRLPGLLLHDGCSGNGFPAMRDIVYPEFDDVAATKLAVDRQIEQGKVSGTLC
jgi:hypothetical protein